MHGAESQAIENRKHEPALSCDLYPSRFQGWQRRCHHCGRVDTVAAVGPNRRNLIMPCCGYW
jgi:hypothetical protein